MQFFSYIYGQYKCRLMSFSLKQIEFDRQIDLAQIREFRKTKNVEILNSVFAKYMHLIYGVGLKQLQSREKALGIIPQVFEQLQIEAEKNEISDLRSWLYKKTINACADK